MTESRETSSSAPSVNDGRRVPLSARIEPFDSYWQAPDDVEKGYTSFRQFYRANFLPHLPKEREIEILVVSCGPGYFVSLLKDEGYGNVRGIDSDAEKINYARRRDLPCEVAEAFPFVEERPGAFDLIICEQELSHLTHDEMLQFLALCRNALKPGGMLFVYGLNGANPLVGSENLAHNIDHFHTFTEYSLNQVLEMSGFQDIRILPWKLFVFWKNPMNYVGLVLTGSAEFFFRCWYKVYGKKVKVLSKKIAATCRKPV